MFSARKWRRSIACCLENATESKPKLFSTSNCCASSDARFPLFPGNPLEVWAAQRALVRCVWGPGEAPNFFGLTTVRALANIATNFPETWEDRADSKIRLQEKHTVHQFRIRSQAASTSWLWQMKTSWVCSSTPGDRFWKLFVWVSTTSAFARNKSTCLEEIPNAGSLDARTVY